MLAGSALPCRSQSLWHVRTEELTGVPASHNAGVHVANGCVCRVCLCTPLYAFVRLAQHRKHVGNRSALHNRKYSMSADTQCEERKVLCHHLPKRPEHAMRCDTIVCCQLKWHPQQAVPRQVAELLAQAAWASCINTPSTFPGAAVTLLWQNTPTASCVAYCLNSSLRNEH